MQRDHGVVATLPDDDRDEVAGPSSAPRDRPPAFVWALIALHVALMVMCSLLYPATYGYDEPQHVDMAYAYSKELQLYSPAERRVAAGIAKTQRGSGYPPRRSFSDIVPQPRGERPSFDEQGGNRQLQGPLPNQLVQHPPLYYLMGGAILRFPGVSHLPYDQQIWLLRMLSVLLLAPLPLLAWAAARALLGPGPPALVAAVLPVTVPGLTRLGGSYNNDTLLILFGAVLLWLLTRVLAGDFRVRTAALVGAALTGALLSKGFALVLPPVVLAAYVVAGLRHRRRPIVPGLVALAVGGVGMLWWLRNLLVFGAVQPNGWGEEAYQRIVGRVRPGGPPDEFVLGFLYRIGLRIWGGIGLPEGPRLANEVSHGWALALVLFVLVGLAVGAGGRWGRATLVVLVLPAVLSMMLVAYESYDFYRNHGGRFVAVQGRYLYVGLTVLAVPFAAGLLRTVPARWSRWVPGALLALGVATQVWAWRTLAQAWWVPDAARGELGPAVTGALDGISAWSPFPPVLTFAPFVASALLAVLALVLAFRPATPPGEHLLAPAAEAARAG